MIRSLLLVLLVSHASYASTPAWRSIASVQPALVQATETPEEIELTSEIERQADVVFKDFVANSGSRVPISVLDQAKRAALYRLKQMHVLSEILKASGPAPAATIVATEVLADFVLAPIATAMGRPGIAASLVAVPWGVVAGFGVFSYQMIKIRRATARSLGLRTLAPLDRLRRLVVGYDVKHRVSSIVYQSLQEDMGSKIEFDVLTRGWSFNEARGPAVTVHELEQLVATAPDGKDYLSAIYNEKLDHQYYASLLMRFVSESEPLTSQLVEIVRSRMPEVRASDDPLALRRHLLGIDDVKMQLDRAIQNEQAKKASLWKRIRGGGNSSATEAYIAREIARLQAMRHKLMAHEYSVLVEAQQRLAAGENMRDVSVASERSKELLAIALEAQVQPPVGSVVGAVAPKASLVDQVRKVVHAVMAKPMTCADVFL